MIHESVLLKELVKPLNINGKKTIVDLTLGAGGHSLEILKDLKEGTLIAFDLSFKALDHFCKLLIKQDFAVEEEVDKKIVLTKGSLKVVLINKNFSEVKTEVNLLGINKVDGIIADLGWSSDELTEIEGLSYQEDINSFLDMRFDKSLAVTASDLLNGLGRKELSKMFESYADVYGKSNQNLVGEILSYRKKGPITKVRDLKLIIDRSFKFKQGNRFQKNEVFKTYSRVFQALRIAVNGELTNLKSMLEGSYELLNKNGVLGIITFHSGEDKIVVPFLQSNKDQKNIEILSQSGDELFTRASIEEIKNNIRSRSSKLYTFTKLK